MEGTVIAPPKKKKPIVIIVAVIVAVAVLLGAVGLILFNTIFNRLDVTKYVDVEIVGEYDGLAYAIVGVDYYAIPKHHNKQHHNHNKNKHNNPKQNPHHHPHQNKHNTPHTKHNPNTTCQATPEPYKKLLHRFSSQNPCNSLLNIVSFPTSYVFIFQHVLYDTG